MEESELNGFDYLPDEILLQVFSHLTVPEMLQSVPFVCVRWYAVSTDPSLYRHVSFRPRKPPTNVAVNIVERATLLTSLQLARRNDADEILDKVGSRHRGLKKLDVYFCKGTQAKRSVSSLLLQNILNHCDKLESVLLEGTHCDCPELYKEIGLKLPLLRYIDFGYAEESFSLEAMLNIVDNCHCVKEFHVLHLMQIPGDVMAAFCNKFHASLTRINVVPVSWTNASLLALTRCSNLTKVELIFAIDVTDEGVMTMKDMPNLRYVFIWGANRVTVQCWIDLMTSPSMREVKDLIFQYCENVTDEVGLTIARELRGLKKLSLICNSVTHEGFLEISRLLPAECHYEYRHEID